MKKFLFTSAALAALAAAAPANAADIPARPQPVYKAPVVAPAVFSWTGFYVGANIGYGWGHFDDGFGNTDSVNGVVGGGQIGANWQTGMFVLGVETDIQGTGQDQTFTAISPNGAVSLRESLPWFGTVRGRAGIAADRWLFYVTGGLAYGETRNDITALTGPFAGVAASLSQTNTGWTAGGGIETALADNWSAKVEYLHLDFGNNTNTAGLTSGKVTDDVVRAGINYRFGWGGGRPY